MPHIGRLYPFHPKYWATRGWFWPGFVAWKMKFHRSTGSPNVLQVLDPFVDYVSEAGVVGNPPLNVIYNWHLVFGSDAYDFILTMSCDSGEPPTTCFWEFSASVNSSPYIYAKTTLALPQYRVSIQRPFGVEIIYPVDGDWGDFNFYLEGSLYRDGGSPYPNDDG